MMTMTECPVPGCGWAMPHTHVPTHANVPGYLGTHVSTPEVSAWDSDVQAVVEALAEHVAIGVAPLAGALQQARQGAAVTLDRFVQCYAALAAVVALLDRGGVRGNWAADQAILDTARDLVARLSPIPPTTGADDDRTPR